MYTGIWQSGEQSVGHTSKLCDFPTLPVYIKLGLLLATYRLFYTAL